MSTTIHFINVGQGNMTLIQTDNRRNLLIDCNVAEHNRDDVLDYVARQIGEGKPIYAFICTHRDSDHMRGIKDINARFPIKRILDSNYHGARTDTSEYRAYMDLRRNVDYARTVEKQTRNDYGRTRLRYLSAEDDRLPNHANTQGIVIKIEHRSKNDRYALSSVLLPGDSDGLTWRDGIMEDYSNRDISSSILMASDHGSTGFFTIPREKNYYKAHMEAIKPEITIVSTGDDAIGYPDEAALRLYRQYSSGAGNGDKIYRTDRHHTMKITLHDGGGWTMETDL